jgi:hypothetical protein
MTDLHPSRHVFRGNWLYNYFRAPNSRLSAKPQRKTNRMNCPAEDDSCECR